MEPKSFSASAALNFEGCEARYNAEYILKTPDLQGEAAGLGSACHGSLEHFIADGHHMDGSDFKVLAMYYAVEYYNYFSDNSRYDEGLAMLKKWFERSGPEYWKGRTVLSTELKETFDLVFYPAEGVKLILPFTYIWDRCDSLKDGRTIEVIDYKSIFKPVTPDDLKVRIQPRAYALAAQIKYPDAERIWVTYDLLRYDQVGHEFKREDNIATWRYLQALAKRVWESDGTEETLNPECKYCVRKSNCDTLNKHLDGGGGLIMASFEEAIDRRGRIDAAVAALRAQLIELDDFILDEMETRQITEFKTSTTHAIAGVASRRTVDTPRVAPILGPEIMAEYGKLGVTDIDALLKNDPRLTDEQKVQVKAMIRKTPGQAKITTKPVSALSEETE